MVAEHKTHSFYKNTGKRIVSESEKTYMVVYQGSCDVSDNRFSRRTGIFANMYCAFSYVNSLTVLEEVLVNHSHVAGCGFDIEFEFESHNVCRHLLCFKSVILGDIAVKIFTSHNADFAYVKAEVIVCVLPQWLQ